MTFQVGDIVRLRRGQKRMEVAEVSRNGRYIRASYRIGSVETDLYMKPMRPAADYVHFEEKEPEVAQKLYATLEENPRYGTFLTHNSEGQLVLEMKGEGGKVEAFAKGSVEEVVPYTFEVRGVMNGGSKSTYTCKEGEVKVGDVLISDAGNLYVVARIDTKCTNPKKQFRGKVLAVSGKVGADD